MVSGGSTGLCYGAGCYRKEAKMRIADGRWLMNPLRGEDMDENDLDLEWENRRLCRDESCIGVIGSDGRCKACGKTGDDVMEEAPFQGLSQVEVVETLSPLEASGEAEEDWERRRLCRDENCIGVIGPDGRCKACGKRDEA
jgi:hypothetical protein